MTFQEFSTAISPTQAQYHSDTWVHVLINGKTHIMPMTEQYARAVPEIVKKNI